MGTIGKRIVDAIAFLENNLNEDGSVRIPQYYMVKSWMLHLTEFAQLNVKMQK